MIGTRPEEWATHAGTVLGVYTPSHDSPTSDGPPLPAGPGLASWEFVELAHHCHWHQQPHLELYTSLDSAG